MKNEMISAVEIYNKAFSNSDKLIEDTLLEKAKESIIQQLNSSNLEIVRNIDTHGGRYDDYITINVVIARTPKYTTYAKQNGQALPAVGEYKLWFLLMDTHRSKFPTEKLNEWLKTFGWEFKIHYECMYSESGDFEVSLESKEFGTGAMNLEFHRQKRNYYPDFLK